MSTVARLSVEQLDRMIKSGVFDAANAHRIELIRGELRKMSPISDEHAGVVDFLTEWSVRVKPAGVRVRIQNPLGIPKLKSVPQPDVAWVREQRSSARPDASDVFLVIEVAQASLRYDRGVKAKLYAKAGVQDYWIVNIPDRRLEILREPLGLRYQNLQTLSPGGEARLLAFPDVALQVAELFDSIA